MSYRFTPAELPPRKCAELIRSVATLPPVPKDVVTALERHHEAAAFCERAGAVDPLSVATFHQSFAARLVRAEQFEDAFDVAEVGLQALLDIEAGSPTDQKEGGSTLLARQVAACRLGLLMSKAEAASKLRTSIADPNEILPGADAPLDILNTGLSSLQALSSGEEPERARFCWYLGCTLLEAGGEGNSTAGALLLREALAFYSRSPRRFYAELGALAPVFAAASSAVSKEAEWLATFVQTARALSTLPPQRYQAALESSLVLWARAFEIAAFRGRFLVAEELADSLLVATQSWNQSELQSPVQIIAEQRACLLLAMREVVRSEQPDVLSEVSKHYLAHARARELHLIRRGEYFKSVASSRAFLDQLRHAPGVAETSRAEALEVVSSALVALEEQG